MMLIEHSTFDASTIASNLGAPEYSYWFVRKAFRPLLERIGQVVSVSNPEADVPALAEEARKRSEPCVLLSFNPPQYMPMNLDCPVVPVFAWEFDRIPDESWNANPQENWRLPLAGAPASITHSRAAIEAVRRTMGAGIAIWSAPAPIYDRAVSHRDSVQPVQEGAPLIVEGGIAIDSWAIDLGLFRSGRTFGDGARAIGLLRRSYETERPAARLRLDGVVYTSVFNPADGRKNWDDMIGAFIWAFRQRTDATLILKVTHADLAEAVLQLLDHIGRQGEFRCRIVIVFGLLSDEAYTALIDATSFCVNTSQGEGQCLPLMEFMSAGRPAVAPNHTAMADYVSAANAFVVACTLRPGFWPHDHRQALRCLRHDVDFADLVARFRESFRCATSDPARYARMSVAASESLRQFCSREVVLPRVRQALARAALGGATGVPTSSSETGGGRLLARIRSWRRSGSGTARESEATGSMKGIDIHG